MTQVAMTMAQVTHRIVGPISMMRPRIIMITNIQVESTLDLSVKNEVINLQDVDFPKDIVLAGATWHSVGMPRAEAIRMILTFVLGRVRQRFTGYALWLLAGHTAWQPNTRIVRYHKLWGSFKKRGMDIPVVAQQYETLLESEEGLKYFGAAQCSEFAIGSVTQVLLNEHNTYLV